MDRIYRDMTLMSYARHWALSLFINMCVEHDRSNML